MLTACAGVILLGASVSEAMPVMAYSQYIVTSAAPGKYGKEDKKMRREENRNRSQSERQMNKEQRRQERQEARQQRKSERQSRRENKRGYDRNDLGDVYKGL